MTSMSTQSRLATIHASSKADEAWAHRPASWEQVWIRAPIAKRTLDVSVSGALILLLAPCLLVIALLIRISSPGPILYRGRRTGRFAEPFWIFKFRTMVVNAERLGGSTTGKNDSRVTPVGAWLRRFKLDELPQLLNVLRGEMSLVGPRPEVYEYTEKFNEEEQLILAVKPGITDLSSLHFIDLQAHVGEKDPDRVFREEILPIKNRLRLRYVRNQSFWLDLQILFWTFVRLLGIKRSLTKESDLASPASV